MIHSWLLPLADVILISDEEGGGGGGGGGETKVVVHGEAVSTVGNWFSTTMYWTMFWVILNDNGNFLSELSI